MSELNNEQWLLSLSCLSLIGPEVDITDLNKRGCFKNERNRFSLNKHISEDAIPKPKRFYSSISVISSRNFTDLVEEQINESCLSKDSTKIIRQCRIAGTSNDDEYMNQMVENREYKHMYIKEVNRFELHWPEHNLKAYDMCNGMMLCRMARNYFGCDDETINKYMEEISNWVIKHYSTYKSFGIDAEIGRRLNLIKSSVDDYNELPILDRHILSKTYHSIWSKLIWPNL